MRRQTPNFLLQPTIAKNFLDIATLILNLRRPITQPQIHNERRKPTGASPIGARMFIVGYLIAIACLVLFIPWLYLNVIITCIQDICKHSHTPSSPSPQNILESNSSTEKEQDEDEDEPEDEDIEFYNYMSGDVYYEDIP